MDAVEHQREGSLGMTGNPAGTGLFEPENCGPPPARRTGRVRWGPA